MLEEYQTSQPILYQIIKNAAQNDKFSHAYLFETSDYNESQKIIKALIKTILCPKHKLQKENCGKCKQCQVIESGNYPEIEIIKPEGIWIKKEQILNLQKKFQKKAIIGTKKIYIIEEAEKLKKEAANSILKFLEEPHPGIIAIIITNNIYQVLETIKSRCQIIKLNKKKNNFTNESTIQKLINIYYSGNQEEENIQKIEKIINFINKYEKQKLSIILYTNNLWHKYIKTKEDYQTAFKIMIMYYHDILNYKTNRKIEYFNDYINEIEKNSNTNSIDELSHKLNVLTTAEEKLKYNANTNLLLDKLIIDLGSEI